MRADVYEGRERLRSGESWGGIYGRGGGDKGKNRRKESEKRWGMKGLGLMKRSGWINGREEDKGGRIFGD